MLGSTVSHYKILEQLGGGGMGVVYKAQDLRLDRPVALKFLPPDLTRDSEARQRFVREAKAASDLQHSNIWGLYDIDETSDGQMFIAMEYLEEPGGAFFALNMLVGTAGGDTHTGSEVREWMKDAGLSDVTRKETPWASLSDT